MSKNTSKQKMQLSLTGQSFAWTCQVQKFCHFKGFNVHEQTRKANAGPWGMVGNNHFLETICSARNVSYRFKIFHTKYTACWLSKNEPMSDLLCEGRHAWHNTKLSTLTKPLCSYSGLKSAITTHNGYIIQGDPKRCRSLSQQFADTLGHHFSLGDQLTGIKLCLKQEYANKSTHTGPSNP